MADSSTAAYRDARDLEGGAGRAAAAYNQGNAAYRDGKIDQAIADYRAALREAPKLADAKRNLEEALRRARESKQSPLTGSGGSQGGGSGGTGSRTGGSTPPPPGAANSPNDSKSDSRSKDRPSLGAPVPNREEAEHWLDALEAERRAARSREQAAKRSDSRDEKVDRDW
jgi:tetratricopeptide (TPR) repeat protein